MIFTAKNNNYDLSKNLRGYDFPIADLLGHVSVTKIWVHSLTDSKSQRRTNLHQTDFWYLPLGAPVLSGSK